MPRHFLILFNRAQALAIGCLAAWLGLATAGGLFLAGESRMDHGGGAAYTTVYGDRIGGAVSLAGPTFHARLRAHEPGHASILGEDSVGTDGETHAAADAQLWLVLERVNCIGTDHWDPPSSRNRVRTMVSTIAAPNIQAIAGT